MRLIQILLFILGLKVFSAWLQTRNPKAEQAAIEAAQEWLQGVDEEKYDESWVAAARLFQEKVPQHTWHQQLSGSRDPLGPVIHRVLKSRQYRTSLPGAPESEYVILQFSSSFAHKASALETVTPMFDGDRGWRVSGYYIQ